MIARDRKKQVYVQNVQALTVFFSSVLQVGDVYGDCHPFTYAEAYSGYRGEPSFKTEEVAPPNKTRLNFDNQLDEDPINFNIIGEKVVTYTPNIRGEAAR
ncbi:hypothetical protein OS242_08665 [Tumebacillus sp. DT12]|uniref:Uncharacterized protein n=1 Tax=Tumebacillus lacus TaxID=2995335 RepID=A0ABT3X362_9BACL|nr:hypothetical protein [Tumebacillus lacus]MCX7570036.1 hypothetical protein [Tumebacillus lacus]